MIVRALYFSPTGSAKKIVSQISRSLAEHLQCDRRALDLGRPEQRSQDLVCAPDDILLVGLPVYGDGLPSLLGEYLSRIRGQGCPAVAVAVYGNRSYGRALLELGDLLTAAGCRVFAAAAFIGQHSFTPQVAASRPDWQDVAVISDFAYKLGRKIDGKDFAPLQLAADQAGRPLKLSSPPELAASFQSCQPQTGEACTGCGFCAQICPVAAIDHDDPRRISGPCLRCCACVNRCPRQAKYFDHPHFRAIASALEESCQERRQPELFL